MHNFINLYGYEDSLSPLVIWCWYMQLSSNISGSSQITNSRSLLSMFKRSKRWSGGVLNIFLNSRVKLIWSRFFEITDGFFLALLGSFFFYEFFNTDWCCLFWTVKLLIWPVWTRQLQDTLYCSLLSWWYRHYTSQKLDLKIHSIHLPFGHQ